MWRPYSIRISVTIINNEQTEHMKNVKNIPIVNRQWHATLPKLNKGRVIWVNSAGLNLQRWVALIDSNVGWRNKGWMNLSLT
jgi:hypothetical protein